MSASARFLSAAGRTVLVLALSALGTVFLTRLAPGYFDDAREMDAEYGQIARSSFAGEQRAQPSAFSSAEHAFRDLLHGNLGQSRQFGVPVLDLIRQRAAVTLQTLAHGIVYAWLIATCAALPCSAIRRRTFLLGVPFTLLLAVPTGAMATLCLLRNQGGPVLVLTLLLVARDFKFLERTFRQAWDTPHLLQARAQGLRWHQLVGSFLLPNIISRLLALAVLSLITALSAIVPIEVIFGVPGLGQLAWSGAMNRDLPVLIGVTLIMAGAVGVAGAFSQQSRSMETA
jgi:peptide/nickel transport system permease protein